MGRLQGDVRPGDRPAARARDVWTLGAYDEDGNVLGWIAWTPGRISVVHYVYVRHEARRAGLAMRLIDAAQLGPRLVYTFRGVKPNGGPSLDRVLADASAGVASAWRISRSASSLVVGDEGQGACPAERIRQSEHDVPQFHGRRVRRGGSPSSRSFTHPPGLPGLAPRPSTRSARRRSARGRVDVPRPGRAPAHDRAAWRLAGREGALPGKRYVYDVPLAIAAITWVEGTSRRPMRPQRPHSSGVRVAYPPRRQSSARSRPTSR